MFAETKKEVIIEHPLDIVYDTLISIFPVKYYKLTKYNPKTYNLTVLDSFNPTFIMKISLKEYTPNTTITYFLVNYPHAILDLTEGGKQAIETVLEELLNQLDKQPKMESPEIENSAIEVVNKDNFVNTTKNKTHTTSIVIGYILSLLSIILPLISIINYDPDDFLMAMFFIAGIVCLSFEISLSVILQYYEDSKSIFHGRIQLCICGLSLIILGILIHPILAIAGVIIPLFTLRYFFKREKSIK